MKIPVIGRISPVPLARFRVAFAVVLLFHLLSLRPDWLVFFGPRGLFQGCLNALVRGNWYLSVLAPVLEISQAIDNVLIFQRQQFSV